MTGSVHDIDFIIIPIKRSNRCLNGNSALPFQNHSVCSCSSFIHVSLFRNRSTGVQQAFRQCCFLLSATQNAKSGKRRDKPKLSGINQHKADCYAVCCVSQVVYPARFSKVSCQKNRCVFASIFLYLLKRRSILNNRFKLF